MRYGKNDLFTPSYAVTYYGWIQTDLPTVEQFRTTYLWCNYYVYTWTSNYYQLVKITDNTGKLLFEGYIKTITDFKNLAKKLNINCQKKCTETDVVFIVDEDNNFITDENYNYLTE
jgi:hypothetical protein